MHHNAQMQRGCACCAEALGITLCFPGKTEAVQAYLEQNIIMCDHQHYALAFLSTQDPEVTCRGFVS